MSLVEIKEAIQTYAGDFDAAELCGTEALRAMRAAAVIKNVAASVEARCAARVAETEIHRGTGERSAAHLLAKETGSTVGAARDAIEAARRLADQPALDAAARAGELSVPQVSAITDAVAADPTAETALLEQVRAGASLAETRDEAARIKAATVIDPEARRRKIHAERYLRPYIDAEGAWNLRVHDNPEVGAAIMARLDDITDGLFNQARREGRREPREAYAADALAQLATTTGTTKTTTNTKVIFRADWAAFLRGWATPGETMEIAGVGPVAASAVGEAIEGGGFVAAVLTKGETLTGVAHLGRAPRAKQQTALEWLYPSCAVLGCFATAHLERDHRLDWAKTKVTTLDWLDLLCRHHHSLKTRKGWALVRGEGKRAFVAPEDGRHPDREKANAPP